MNDSVQGCGASTVSQLTDDFGWGPSRSSHHRRVRPATTTTTSTTTTTTTNNNNDMDQTSQQDHHQQPHHQSMRDEWTCKLSRCAATASTDSCSDISDHEDDNETHGQGAQQDPHRQQPQQPRRHSHCRPMRRNSRPRRSSSSSVRQRQLPLSGTAPLERPSVPLTGRSRTEKAYSSRSRASSADGMLFRSVLANTNDNSTNQRNSQQQPQSPPSSLSADKWNQQTGYQPKQDSVPNRPPSVVSATLRSNSSSVDDAVLAQPQTLSSVLSGSIPDSTVPLKDNDTDGHNDKNHNQEQPDNKSNADSNRRDQYNRSTSSSAGSQDSFGHCRRSPSGRRSVANAGSLYQQQLKAMDNQSRRRNTSYAAIQQQTARSVSPCSTDDSSYQRGRRRISYAAVQRRRSASPFTVERSLTNVIATAAAAASSSSGSVVSSVFSSSGRSGDRHITRSSYATSLAQRRRSGDFSVASSPTRSISPFARDASGEHSSRRRTSYAAVHANRRSVSPFGRVRSETSVPCLDGTDEPRTGHTQRSPPRQGREEQRRPLSTASPTRRQLQYRSASPTTTRRYSLRRRSASPSRDERSRSMRSLRSVSPTNSNNDNRGFAKTQSKQTTTELMDANRSVDHGQPFDRCIPLSNSQDGTLSTSRAYQSLYTCSTNGSSSNSGRYSSSDDGEISSSSGGGGSSHSVWSPREADLMQEVVEIAQLRRTYHPQRSEGSPSASLSGSRRGVPRMPSGRMIRPALLTEASTRSLDSIQERHLKNRSLETKLWRFVENTLDRDEDISSAVGSTQSQDNDRSGHNHGGGGGGGVDKRTTTTATTTNPALDLLLKKQQDQQSLMAVLQGMNDRDFSTLSGMVDAKVAALSKSNSRSVGTSGRSGRSRSPIRRRYHSPGISSSTHSRSSATHSRSRSPLGTSRGDEPARSRSARQIPSLCPLGC